MNDTKSRRGIQSIEIAGRVLEALATSARPMMLKEIASATDLSPAQLHAYLLSLKVINLVEQDAGNGRYQLGRFALTLGLARQRSFDPLRLASSEAYELSLSLNALVTVNVWDTGRPVILQVHRGSPDIHVQIFPGSSYQLLNSAAGRLFAAYLPNDVIDPLLEAELLKGYRTTLRSPVTSIAQWQEIATVIRERGFSAMSNSPFEGLNAASCPVVNGDGQLQFSVTVIGLAWDFRLDENSVGLEKLTSMCHAMSAELGLQ